MKGESLDQISKRVEEGKRPYQKILFIIATTVLSAMVASIMLLVF